MGLLAACAAFDAAAQIPADFWQPGVTVAARYDEADATSYGGRWITIVTPHLALEHRSPLANWELRGRRSFESYANARSPRPATDVASARISGAPAEHLEVTLAGYYQRVRDPIQGDPHSTLTSGETATSSASGRVRGWRGEAAYQERARAFEAAALTDAKLQSGSAAVFPLRSEQGLWLIGWRGLRWTFRDQRALTASIVTVGLRRVHSDFWSSELELGGAAVADPANGTRSRRLAVVAGSTGFGRTLGLPFDARFRVAHDVTTTALAEVWREVVGTRLAGRWERTLDAEGGVFDRPTVRNLVAVVIKDTLSGIAILGVEGSYAHAATRREAGPRVGTFRAMVSAARDLWPWMTGRVAYSFVRQDRSEALGLPDYHRNRVEVSFTATVY